MDDTGALDAQVVRRHYVFALRGELSIPEPGWTVVVHSSACAEPGSGCRQTPDCRLTHSVFLKAALVSAPTLTPGVVAMSGMVDWLTGKDPNHSFAPPPTNDKRLQVAVTASAPIDVDYSTTLENHFDTCFNLARDSARALQQVTGDLSAPLTRQQLLPFYFVVDEDAAGNRTASHIVVIEDAYLGSSFAKPGQADSAEAHLLAAWSNNPVEHYHDMNLGARRALYAEGNYVDAVLRSAAACEILIKHTAWMTTWEAREVTGIDPLASDLSTDKILGANPKTLIGNVLAGRLNGNWGSRDTSTPVGGWRHDVAQMRNRVIHRGYRPTEREAVAATVATQLLETRTIDRLAAKVAMYPRAALLLAGKEGLERRHHFGPAKATWKNEDLRALLVSYNTWLDQHHVSDADD